MQSLYAWTKFSTWSRLLALLVLQGVFGCSQLNQPTLEGLKAVQVAAATQNIQSVRQQTNYGATFFLKGRLGNRFPY